MIRRWFARRFKDEEAMWDTILDFCMFGAGIAAIQIAGLLVVKYLPLLFK